jgi:hypothetical protein
MEHCPSGADTHSSGQEILRLLWNQKVLYSVHKSPSSDPILSQSNPFRISASYFSKIQFNIQVQVCWVVTPFTSKMLVSCHNTSRHHSSEDLDLNLHCRENLKFRILIYSSHLRICHPSGPLPSDFSTEIMYTFLIYA